MADQRLGIADEEFWNDPWRTRKAIQRKLMEKKEEAFIIDAPERVTMDSRSTLPLAVLRVYKVGAESHFVRSAVITAVNLHNGELSAGRAFDPPPPVARPAGAGGASDAMMGEASVIDLSQRLQLPMARADYLLTMIVLDRVTPRRRMRVVESAAYEDPAVDEFLRTHVAARSERPKAFPATGSDPRSILPVYDAMDESPPIPEVQGIELTVDRVTLLPATACAVWGSFRLPVEARHVVPKGPTTPGAKLTTAILPITLLLTGSVDPTPKIARLQVPCHRALTAVGGQSIATGHFTVDLAKLVKIGMTPQTYFIYAFSGPVMHGPTPAAFVHIPLTPTARPDSVR